MYIFIVNPTAGRRRAMNIFSKIKSSKLYQEIDSRYFLTNRQGEAEEIVRHLVQKRHQKVTAIIIIGGDGTIHEVINGIGKMRIPISVIPSGSGNDFVRGCSIMKKPIDILRATINGKHNMPYWLGNYQMDNGMTRCFVNSIGFGFDAEIARVANRSFYKKTLNKLGMGKLGYVIALLQVLAYFKPLDIEVEVNGRQRMLRDCWMITITNHPYYGGGMKIIPNAKIQSSVFPVLIIHSISRWKILGLFMTVFTGKHIRYKEAELLEATKVKVSSKDNLYCQVDGEVDICNPCTITKQSTPIQVRGSNIRKQSKIAL